MGTSSTRGITHFPAIHARDGSISYKLEWNGLSMVFSGDTLPNEYVLENAKGVDVLVHEMVVPPDIWAEKNSGLQPGDPGWDQALNVATERSRSPRTRPSRHWATSSARRSRASASRPTSR